jgi:uncharacterized membrane protein
MATPPEEYVGQVHWSRLRQDVAIVVWPSFLVAAVATMICFAFIDPVLIGHDDYPPPAFASREGGYAIGFFFFWLVATLASLLTLYLARTAVRRTPHTTSVEDERERRLP